MKLKNIFSLLLASVAMLSIYSCEPVSPEAGITSGDEIKFILKEDVVDLTSASIRVKHNGPSDLMWVYMQTADLLAGADALIAERVNNEYAFTEQIVARTGNNKSIRVDGLEAKSQYRIIVKAIGQDGQLYGNAASLVFKTRRNPDAWEVNDNWTLTRKAERSESTSIGAGEVVEFENFECISKDDESYIVLALSKEDYQAYQKDENHKDVKRTLFEDYYADFMASADNKGRILKGNGIWKEERLRSGDYVVFMIGLDEENELSGLYRQFNVTIAPEEPTEDYNKWLGWWEVSFDNGDAPWTVYIDSLDPNMWCLSIGWEPECIALDVTNMGVKLYYSKSSGELYFTSQEVATADDGSSVYYYGTFPYGTYQTVLDVENTRIAKASFTNLTSTEAVIDGLEMMLSGVGTIKFSYGLFYVRYSSTSAQAVSLTIPSYPWTMKKIDDPTVTE